MNFTTRITAFASASTAVMTWASLSDLSAMSAVVAAAAAGANIGLYLLSRHLNPHVRKYEAALLVRNVCPSCMMPHGITEVTSPDPEERWCHCGYCRNGWVLKGDGKGYIAASRVGKFDLEDEQ